MTDETEEKPPKKIEIETDVHYVLLLIGSTWEIWLEAAPWLLVGLVVAGILKAWAPPQFLQRWLGGRGFYPVLKAAVIGTPLPLCSYSILPTATQSQFGHSWAYSSITSRISLQLPPPFSGS